MTTNLTIKCPERLKDFPESYHPYSCRCKGTGQINPEISAEEIYNQIRTANCDKSNLNLYLKKKFIPSSAVQEIVGEKCVHLQKQLEDKDIQIEDLTLLIKNESKIVTALDEVRTGKFYCVDDEGNFVRPEIRIRQLEDEIATLSNNCKQEIDMHKDDYDNGLKEWLEDKDKFIANLKNIIETERSRHSRDILALLSTKGEATQEQLKLIIETNKKKLLDEVEKNAPYQIAQEEWFINIKRKISENLSPIRRCHVSSCSKESTHAFKTIKTGNVQKFYYCLTHAKKMESQNTFSRSKLISLNEVKQQLKRLG